MSSWMTFPIENFYSCLCNALFGNNLYFIYPSLKLAQQTIPFPPLLELDNQRRIHTKIYENVMTCLFPTFHSWLQIFVAACGLYNSQLTLEILCLIQLLTQYSSNRDSLLTCLIHHLIHFKVFLSRICVFRVSWL